jgi:hypothetical protein
MAGLDPAIQVVVRSVGWTWMPGSSPGMTFQDCSSDATAPNPRDRAVAADQLVFAFAFVLGGGATASMR